MERDAFGICLSQQMLAEHLQSTFTHVRAYGSEQQDDLQVVLSIPQMTGQDLLDTIQSTEELVWRADFHCPGR
ncbi:MULTISPECIES: hypothetical protein [unclassified Vibrio]|uniref:hypothetical protein n=1 Tax=unclassified Vibrio TaxID=2614977 RepID=UPI0010A68B36|nr:MULTISPECIES: hypothetical protein [unclassified Vibrio]WGY46789.1 hypothetical protein J0X00_18545 [Vibrio sp. ABG19]